MITVKAFIERAKNGKYNVYSNSHDNRLDYGIIGEGVTVEEAKIDFTGCYEDMRQSYKRQGKIFTEAEFIYEYDMASFLNYFSNTLSLAGLSRITGINQQQLSHYATGRKRPRPATVHKIEYSLQNLSKDLSQVRLSSSL
jgi:hypothetical protein